MNKGTSLSSKYDLLQDYLFNLPVSRAEITLSFPEIEIILQCRLPESAFRYPAWWANQLDLTTRSQTKAWITAGFKVDGFYQEQKTGWVRFVRSGAVSDKHQKQRAAPARRSKGKPEARGKKTGAQRFRPDENAVYLVSCVSMKSDRDSMAKDLYVSPWFRKARAFVERRRACWFILSAEYGLVRPDQKIAPYEKTLNTLGVAERRKWAEKVIEQMRSELPDASKIVLFAGQRYREFLMDYLQQRYSEVVAPLSRLGIGKQLGWFDQDSRDDTG